MSSKKLYTMLGCILLVVSVIGVAYAFYAENNTSITQAEFLRSQQAVNNEQDNQFSERDQRIIQEENFEAVVSDNGKSLPAKIQGEKIQNKIVIPGIGVDTEILFATTPDPESALEFGAWIVNDFSVPSHNYLVDSSKPVIIASHLYGYKHWSETFRNRVSFKGLETLERGNRVKVYWENRLYEYEIVSGELNTEITNYDTDLILYTCNDLTGSDVRVIKYANLVV